VPSFRDSDDLSFTKGLYIMSTPSTAKYVFQPYVSPSPDAEIMGQIMFAYTQNIRAEEMASILQKYDLTDIQPDQWYPYQLCMDF